MELLDKDNSNVTSRDNWLRIKRDDPSLTRLKVTSALLPDFSHNLFIEDSEIGELGRDIGKNTQLRWLFIRGIFDQHFQLLCEGFHRNRSIEKAVLKNCGRLGTEMFQLLTPFLESNNNLQFMGFGMCPLNREGMPSLMAPLMRRRRPLNRLDLQWNGINDDLVEGLVMGVRENPALCPKAINLSCNHISEIGCGLFATLLQDTSCMIEELNFYGSGGVGDTSAMLLADALVGNITLRVLELGGRGITATGLRAMSQLLCNTTNINTTYSSNHTLRNFAFRSDENVDDLRLYLVWNENENKKMVARKKVFMKHFIQNFHMEPFEEMEPDIFIRVIGFVERASMENGGVTNANAHNSIVYQLIKNNPTVLCEIAKPEPIGNYRKRKHV